MTHDQPYIGPMTYALRECKEMHMTVQVDSRAYLSSLGAELDVQAQRVRNLIGNQHWLSDGHHKEALLRGLLERHLPAGADCTRGFVVDFTSQSKPSREQDILVLDSAAEAPLFRQGGLTICFPSAVLAAVSVKTKFDKLKSALQGLLEREILVSSNRGLTPWLGVYFFNEDSEPDRERDYARAIANSLSAIDFRWPVTELCIRVSQTYFARIDLAKSGAKIDVFAWDDCSTGIFLARLLDRLASVTSGGAGQSDFADLVDIDSGTVKCARETIDA